MSASLGETTEVLDLVVVAATMLRDVSLFASVGGTRLPFVLIFVATWATGMVAMMTPARA